MVRSRGQREESRTSGGFEDSGGDEDSGRSRGQGEKLRSPGDIKKGSIHNLKGSYSLKKGCLSYKGSFTKSFACPRSASVELRTRREWRTAGGAEDSSRHGFGVVKLNLHVF